MVMEVRKGDWSLPARVGGNLEIYTSIDYEFVSDFLQKINEMQVRDNPDND